MRTGETIHTENSHKFTRRSANLLLQAAGWTPRKRWLDSGERFSLILAEATQPPQRALNLPREPFIAMTVRRAI